MKTFYKVTRLFQMAFINDGQYFWIAFMAHDQLNTKKYCQLFFTVVEVTVTVRLGALVPIFGKEIK